ncbi:MAG: FmdB family zinc ribbon protein [Solirubrobacterales bacterium]
MPIYEYKCENGHVFDVMQKMADEPLTSCVECGAPCARVLTAPAVHFKGSGFYNTDYGKRKGGGNGAGSEGGGGGAGAEGGSGGGESGSGESKSDSSKSETKSSAAAD